MAVTPEVADPRGGGGPGQLSRADAPPRLRGGSAWQACRGCTRAPARLAMPRRCSTVLFVRDRWVAGSPVMGSQDHGGHDLLSVCAGARRYCARPWRRARDGQPGPAGPAAFEGCGGGRSASALALLRAGLLRPGSSGQRAHNETAVRAQRSAGRTHNMGTAVGIFIDPERCGLRHITMHEFGHALGRGHGARPRDLMHSPFTGCARVRREQPRLRPDWHQLAQGPGTPGSGDPAVRDLGNRSADAIHELLAARQH